MNRSMVRSLAKVLAGVVAVLSISMAPVGCAQKKCGGCPSAKNCGPGCTKPCCKKEGAAAKPEEKKDAAAKPAEKKP